MIGVLVVLCGLLLLAAPIGTTFKMGGIIGLIIITVLLIAFCVPLTV